SALSEIEFPTFSFKISGTGTFEKKIFWAGTEENENLENLQKEVFEKLKSLGLEPEEREFVPHITLARKFKPGEKFSFEETGKLLPEKAVFANRISLMKSERIEGVLRYTEIYSRNLL
ncbi:MAG: RNA 2',3'-cyclic phosphodiesterase, partial [Oscillospiraceae bacterium]|nr:RNA 2',3'-cyclic phosphodiesterase [Oscillospiraceae bacterium]